VTAVAAIVAAVTVPVRVGDAESTTLPVPVEVVTPVPPLLTARVPETSEPSAMLPVVKAEPLPRRGPLSVVLTAKVPAPVTGDPVTVKPVGIVRPTLVTLPAPDAAQAPSPRRNDPLLQVPDQRLITFADVAAVNGDAPLPRRSPVSDVAPVPPFPTGSVPETSEPSNTLLALKPLPLPWRTPLRVVETASVPLDVTGEPVTLKPVGIVRPTELTAVPGGVLQEPSPRRYVPLLQVPENVLMMSVDTAAVVTYVLALPLRMPVAGEKRLNVAAAATPPMTTEKPMKKFLNCERVLIP
jgi:hypothetical protein